MSRYSKLSRGGRAHFQKPEPEIKTAGLGGISLRVTQADRGLPRRTLSLVLVVVVSTLRTGARSLLNGAYLPRRLPTTRGAGGTLRARPGGSESAGAATARDSDPMPNSSSDGDRASQA